MAGTVTQNYSLLKSNNLQHFVFRHILAILHFNENIKREAKKAKNGKTYMSIRYPKYKNGEELVRIVPVTPTYKYVDNLRRIFFQLDKKTMKDKVEQFRKIIPGPLCSKFDGRLNRDAAIQNYRERKQMSVELYPSCKFPLFTFYTILVLASHSSFYEIHNHRAKLFPLCDCVCTFMLQWMSNSAWKKVKLQHCPERRRHHAARSAKNP